MLDMLTDCAVEHGSRAAHPALRIIETAAARTVLRHSLERIVAEAVADGRVLDAGREALLQWRSFRRVGLEIDEIYDEVLAAAVRGRAAVFMNRPATP